MSRSALMGFYPLNRMLRGLHTVTVGPCKSDSVLDFSHDPSSSPREEARVETHEGKFTFQRARQPHAALVAHHRSACAGYSVGVALGGAGLAAAIGQIRAAPRSGLRSGHS